MVQIRHGATPHTGHTMRQGIDQWTPKQLHAAGQLGEADILAGHSEHSNAGARSGTIAARASAATSTSCQRRRRRDPPPSRCAGEVVQ